MKIQMTDPKGITLLTAGKKLDENIEVVPDFTAAETATLNVVGIDENYNIIFMDMEYNAPEIYYTTIENGKTVNKVFAPTENTANDTTLTVVANTLIYIGGAFVAYIGYNDPNMVTKMVGGTRNKKCPVCENVSEGFTTSCMTLEPNEVYTFNVAV